MFPRPILPLVLLLAAAPAGAFDYGGLALETEAGRLRELFPASSHEFWQRSSGSILVPEDEEGRFDDAVRSGDGRYVARLAPEDTRAEVTSVALTLEQGRTVRMTLGLERDSKGFTPEAIERRFPGCRGVLDALVARYGQPTGFVSRNDEGLEWRVRTWKGLEGAIRLECGRFPGREAIFAIDVEIEAPRAGRTAGDEAAPARPAGSSQPSKPPAAKPAETAARPAEGAPKSAPPAKPSPPAKPASARPDAKDARRKP
jgi:hypothetical protein